MAKISQFVLNNVSPQFVPAERLFADAQNDNLFLK